MELTLRIRAIDGLASLADQRARVVHLLDIDVAVRRGAMILDAFAKKR